MAGHNKWSSIKHKKAKTDAQKGKLFSKLAREIIMATKIGGPDQDMNPRLRLAIQNAKEGNMPNENIKRAIQKGDGTLAGEALEEIIFEAYAPGGVAILIGTLTDNRTRTVANVKHILTKGGGSMATKGAVSYLFHQKALFVFPESVDPDKVITIATDQGAEDVDIKEDGTLEVIGDVSSFSTLRDAFQALEMNPSTSSILMLPDNYILPEKAIAKSVLNLIEALEEDDDVQHVDTNMDIPDELLNELI